MLNFFVVEINRLSSSETSFSEPLFQRAADSPSFACSALPTLWSLEVQPLVPRLQGLAMGNPLVIGKEGKNEREDMWVGMCIIPDDSMVPVLTQFVFEL